MLCHFKTDCLYHWSQILWYNECLQLFHFTLFKRNKQKVYGHSLADSRRISRLIHAWSRTEKPFSVLFVKKISYSVLHELAISLLLLLCITLFSLFVYCFCLQFFVYIFSEEFYLLHDYTQILDEKLENFKEF